MSETINAKASRPPAISIDDGQQGTAGSYLRGHVNGQQSLWPLYGEHGLLVLCQPTLPNYILGILSNIETPADKGRDPFTRNFHFVCLNYCNLASYHERLRSSLENNDIFIFNTFPISQSTAGEKYCPPYSLFPERSNWT